ncbi:MAG: hypothetical protein NVSMB1_09460 [Polyangiales bacterium]
MSAYCIGHGETDHERLELHGEHGGYPNKTTNTAGHYCPTVLTIHDKSLNHIESVGGVDE